MSIIHPAHSPTSTSGQLPLQPYPSFPAQQPYSTLPPSSMNPQFSPAASTSRLSPGQGQSRSAPVSPRGRLALYGIAPLSSISPIHLAQQPENMRQWTLSSTHSPPFDSANFREADSSHTATGTGGSGLLSKQKPRPRRLAHLRHSSIPSSSTTGSASIGENSSGGYLSEEGFDSDATVRPAGSKYKQSLSQPDLTTLYEGKAKGLEAKEGMGRKDVQGWVGEVGRGHVAQPASQHMSHQQRQQERRRPSFGRTKSTGEASSKRPGVADDSWLPAAPSRSPHSRSHSSLYGMRKSPSPRSQALSFPTMSPINPPSVPLPDQSPKVHRHSLAVVSSLGGNMSSEGDDSSESGDSLTFAPKRTKSLPLGSELRQRFQDPRLSIRRRSSSSRSGDGGLGLLLGSPSSIPNTTSTSAGSLSGLEMTPKTVPQPLPDELERMIRRSSLLYLRLLAIVPAVWGICVLAQALATGGLWVDVWPYGVDLSKEALERLVAGGVMMEGEWIRVDRGDMVLCIAWAICTGHFCFCLTTGLTHRWLSYYSLPSTITRLASLQCLCWPATYLTLWVLGARNARPLLAWVVIGVTTGWSRTVQMWVTSNVIPADLVSPVVATNHVVTPTPRNPDVVAVRQGSKQTTMLLGPPPDHLCQWEKFVWGRKWDWDAVASEVGWKVGGLLLVTTAWLFWGIECGSVIRA
ncbi:hypothetical protein C364_04024 [Cryptococcus neoformans Bt63]|nr:hypothetical protein C364_04024 [Cryptococcus neoformans var. grubii Bt63]